MTYVSIADLHMSRFPLTFSAVGRGGGLSLSPGALAGIIAGGVVILIIVKALVTVIVILHCCLKKASCSMS